MGLLKGKYIRIKCDAELLENWHHPSNIIDRVGKNFNDILLGIKHEGWHQYDGEWFCADCCHRNPLIPQELKKMLSKTIIREEDVIDES